jgi:hypothetical protein
MIEEYVNEKISRYKEEMARWKQENGGCQE